MQTALICVAPEYVPAVGYDYALRIGAPPPRVIDEAVAGRLGVRIALFTGDVVVPVAQDAEHNVCGPKGCVVVGSFDESPTSLRISWGGVSRTSGDASVHDSLTITAKDPEAKAAAIKAVFLPTGKPCGFLPLSLVVQKKSGK